MLAKLRGIRFCMIVVAAFVALSLHLSSQETSAFVKLLVQEYDSLANATTTANSEDCNHPMSSRQSEESNSNDLKMTSTTVLPQRNLLVMDALGRTENLRHMVFAKVHHMPDWTCLAFMYVDETIIPDSHPDMIALRDKADCTVIRTPNVQWGNFLQYLPPALVDQYQHVAILLDDIFLPDRGPRPVNVTQLLDTMEQYNLDSIQPAVRGDGWMVNPDIRKRSQFLDCLLHVPMIETFFQIFTRSAWQCYYSMLHYKYGRGFCLDMCFEQYCNVTLATDFTMTAYHLEKARELIPPEAIEGTYLTFDPVVRIENGFYLPKGQKPNNGEGCHMGGRPCPGFRHPLPIHGPLHCPRPIG